MKMHLVTGVSFPAFSILVIIGLLNVVVCARRVQHQADYDDNDFAEFEDFDEKIPGTGPPPMRVKGRTDEPPVILSTEEEINDGEDEEEQEGEMMLDEDDGIHIREDENIVQLQEEEVRERKRDFDDEDEAVVEEEDDNDEFSHFADEDEFIGFDSDRPQTNSRPSRNQEEPKITIAKVPLHLRSNWDSFYLEMLMMAGLIVYFINFMLGKSKNQKIATTWFTSHKALLESNFSLVGDDGKSAPEGPVGPPHLLKESENVYILWCSGRMMVEGMLLEIKLLKRQDLIGVISQLMRPSSDQLIAKITLEEMDTFVFCVGTKKAVGRISKEMADISTFCPEKKTVDRFSLGSQYVMHTEMPEVSNIILRDPKVLAVLNKFPDLLEYMHFSDQYSGPKQQEDSTATKLPEVKKTLIFCFNMPGKGQPPLEEMDNLKPLMQLVVYMCDKIARFKISKEAKNKADKNRSKVEEAFLKSIHSARAEIAQQTREDKKRLERERIMSLDDPEKQRKWEERENKREMKKRAPKMKTLKIKPM